MRTISRLFPSPSRRRISPAGLEPRSRGSFLRALLFGEMIVIGRSLLHFERIERPPGPIDARMRAAMKLMARTRAPFENPGVHIIWQARHVAVWSWDMDRLTQLGADDHAWFMPEPALGHDKFMPGTQDIDAGFGLIERRDGYEGQLWQAGELSMSRFWNRQPEPEELARFRRGAHAETDVIIDDSDRSSQAFQERARTIVARFRPVHAAALALLLVGAPLLHAAGSHIRLSVEQSAARQDLAAFAENSAGDFDALDRYRAHTAQLVAYRETLEQINPLTPAADLAEVAGELGSRVTRLRVEPDGVSALIESQSGLDPATLAQELELRPSLANVSLNRTPNSAAWEAQADLVASRDAEGGE